MSTSSSSLSPSLEGFFFWSGFRLTERGTSIVFHVLGFEGAEVFVLDGIIVVLDEEVDPKPFGAGSKDKSPLLTFDG